MKQLLLSFTTALLLFVLVGVGLAQQSVNSSSGSLEPSNIDIQTLASKIFEANRHVFPNAKRVPIGACVKIPLPSGKDTLVEMKDWTWRGDNHDCYWWTAREVLITEHQKTFLSKPVAVASVAPVVAAPKPFHLPWRERFLIGLALILLIIFVLILDRMLRDPSRFSPVVPGGLRGMNAEQALSTVVNHSAYASGPRPIRAQWGRYRNRLPRRSHFARMLMLTGAGNMVRVNLDDGQRVLRVWFSETDFRDYLEGCANMAYYRNETHLPEGWEWEQEVAEGSEHVVSQPEEPATVRELIDEVIGSETIDRLTEVAASVAETLSNVIEKNKDESSAINFDSLVDKAFANGATFIELQDGPRKVKITLSGQKKSDAKPDSK